VFIVLDTVPPGVVPFLIVEYLCPFVAPVDTNTVTQFEEVAVNAPTGISAVWNVYATIGFPNASTPPETVDIGA